MVRPEVDAELGKLWVYPWRGEASVLETTVHLVAVRFPTPDGVRWSAVDSVSSLATLPVEAPSVGPTVTLYNPLGTGPKALAARKHNLGADSSTLRNWSTHGGTELGICFFALESGN